MIESYLQHSPTLGKGVFIHPMAYVSGQTHLGDDCSVWPMAVIRGDVNAIAIGQQTNVQDGAVLHVTHDSPYQPGGLTLEVGAEVTVGHKAILHACQVGNACLIGMNATVLDGAIVEDYVMLAAGSVVTPGKTLTSHSLWLGSPAKKARDLTEQEIEFLHYSAQHYVRLKNDTQLRKK